MAEKTIAKTKITDFFGKSPGRKSNKQSTKARSEASNDEEEAVNGNSEESVIDLKPVIDQENAESIESMENNAETNETQGEVEDGGEESELHFPCSNCDFITGDENEIIQHMAECSEEMETINNAINAHLLKSGEIVQQNTDLIETGNIEDMSEIQNETGDDEDMEEMQYPCSNCDYFTSDLEEIAVHMATCTGENEVETIQETTIEMTEKENFNDSSMLKNLDDSKIELHYTCSNCDFIGLSEDEILAHMKSCPDDYELKTQPYYTVYKHDLVKRTYKFIYSSQDQESNKKALVIKALESASSKQKLKKMRILDASASNSSPNISQKYLRADSAYNIAKKQKIKLSGKKEYVCDLCQFTTDNKHYIEQHVTMVHSNEKPIKCELCDYRCKRIGDLRSHMLVHQEKVYNWLCKICGWATYKSSKLKVHMRTHSEEKPYKCDLCDYASHKTDGLSSHMKIHSLERPHKCDICGRAFKQAHNLNSHKKIHTGNQPKKHPCTVCDYIAMTPHILKHHMLTHTNEKPYKCPKCDYRCKIKSNLKCHMTKHSNKKPYICFECGFSTKLPQTLQRHMKIHGIDPRASKNYQAINDICDQGKNIDEPETEKIFIKCEF